MKLTKIAGECTDKVTCPTIYITDRDTVVVQGYRILDADALRQMRMPASEGAVEIPRSLWNSRTEQ